MAKKNIGAILTLRDNMSATLKGIRKEQSEFRKDVENTRKTLERTYKRKHTMQLNNTAAMKKIKDIRKALEPLRNKVVVALAHKDMATAKIRKTHNKLKALGKKTFAPIVTIKDKTGAFFSKIKDKVFNLKTLAGTVLAGIGAGKILGSGAELEKQQISMKHFIGINSKGLDESGIQKITDDFMKQLRDNAKVTPFSSSEVIAAGTRALGVAGGDASTAMELVKVAEDMAALTPGKDISMAMEALADAKNGEMERLKEFNAKVSADEFKQLGFEGVVDKKLKSQFEGGSAKLSKSASGMWSTVTGGIGATLQDLGLKVIEKLMPHLESFVTWMDKSGPTIDLWAERIATGIGFVIDKGALFIGKVKECLPIVKEIVGNVVDRIGEKFGWLGEKTGFLKEVFSTAWGGIKEVMKISWKVMQPIFKLIANATKLLFETFEFAFPGIKKVVQSTWKVVKPILETLGEVLGWVGDKVGKLADWVGEKKEKRKRKKAAKSGVGNVNGSHAGGLSRVPFDGYIAELHKDEAVVPANQNPFIQNNTVTNKEERPIVVNINGVNKSTNEIINELVPQLKLALSNM